MSYLKNAARAIALLPVCAAICSAVVPLRYEVGFEPWNTHLVDVTIHASGLIGKAVLFSMPAWGPGSYGIRNFASEVQAFSATDTAGHVLPWHKTDSQTWEVDLNAVSAAIIHYKVYANSLGSIQYDDRHVALNGPGIWMYQVNAKDRPIALTIDTSHLPSDWKIATGLEKTATTSFYAADYDWFADCPIEISAFSQKDITALGTTYHFIVHDEGSKQDYTQFTRDMQRIIEKGLAPILAPAVGGPLAAPFPEYWFLIHLTNGPGGGGGGVEHLNSTKISYSSDWGDSSATTHDYMTNVYETKIFVAVHELMHAWNVKRLRPRPLGPFDYTQPVHTNSLWISEGLTSYYTCVALLRSGYWTPEQYLGYVSRLITALEAMPGRTERSVAETSWDTWFGRGGGGGAAAGGLSFASNLGNTNYSYYDGGQTLGVLLDLEIRQRTNNRKSLDDWMRSMYQGFALPKPGFNDGDVVRIASATAGTDMSEFFRRYLFGKDPLPYVRDFAYAGIDAQKTTSSQGWSGAVLAPTRDGHAVIGNIIPGSPAERDGLDRGDIVIAIDAKPLDRAGIDRELGARRPNDRVMFTVTHQGVSRQIPVTLATNPYPTYDLKPSATRSTLQENIYRGVLNVK
jgi:predicted metalloprotease with PDZ domain